MHAWLTERKTSEKQIAVDKFVRNVPRDEPDEHNDHRRDEDNAEHLAQPAALLDTRFRRKFDRNGFFDIFVTVSIARRPILESHDNNDAAAVQFQAKIRYRSDVPRSYSVQGARILTQYCWLQNLPSNA